MTTVRHFKCDFCGRTKTGPADVHGLTWTLGGTDLGEREPGQVLLHLCKSCMSAIKRVQLNQDAALESEPDETPEPTATEEPDKPPEPPPDCDDYYLLDALSRANQKIVAQATAPKGVLKWEQPRLGLFTAESASSGAHYGVSCDGEAWVALSRGIQIRRGTVYECMAACEEREANPDKPPPKTKEAAG